MRYLQKHLCFHSQVVRRVEDNSLVKEQTLYNGIDPGIEGLYDVDFRVGKFGRLQWIKGGVEYYLQWMPPSLQEMAAPSELMVAQMDYVGVDKALLSHGHVYGKLNDYLSECVRKLPERLVGAAQIQEEKADEESEILELRRAIRKLGLSALYFECEGFFVSSFRDNLDDEKFFPFWDEVHDLGIPVLWDLRPLRKPIPEEYLDQIRRLNRWAHNFPDIDCLITHGLQVRFFIDENKIPKDVIDVLGNPNVHLELLFPILMPSYEYPYPRAQELIKNLYSRLGAEKMLWGSDMPAVERKCTYKQSLDYLRYHCNFISEADMELILGGNAMRLLNLKC